MTRQEPAERCSYRKNHIQKIETAVAPSVDALLDSAIIPDIPPNCLKCAEQNKKAPPVAVLLFVWDQSLT